MVHPALVLISDFPQGKRARFVRAFLERYGFVMQRWLSTAGYEQAISSEQFCASAVLFLDHTSALVSRTDVLLSNRRIGAAFVIASPSALSVLSVAQPSEWAASIPARVRVHDAALSAQLSAILDGYQSGTELVLEPIVVSGYTLLESENGKRVKEEVPQKFVPMFDTDCCYFSIGESTLLCDEKGSVLEVGAGGWIVAGFDLLGVIAQWSMPIGLSEPMFKVSGERNGENLELLFLLAIARQMQRRGFRLISLDPWPYGTNHVVTVRHDVDREVAADDWQRLMRFHQLEQLNPSWYYLRGTINPERIDEAVQRGHEVGLHYTTLAVRGEMEDSSLRNAVTAAGGELAGATCHGGNFFGQSDLEWLVAKDYCYGEVLTRCPMLPYLVPTETGSIVVTARHLSVDKAMSPPLADFGYGFRTRDARLRVGASVVIMNHPDINFEQFSEAVAAYMTHGSASWTQLRVARWWVATHNSVDPPIHVELQGSKLALRARQADGESLQLRVWGATSTADGADERFMELHSLVELPASGEKRDLAW